MRVAVWFISDVRFYLGGPTSVRGFGMYCIGPQSEGWFHFRRFKKKKSWTEKRSLFKLRIDYFLKKWPVCCFACSGDYLGGDAYWAGGLHLYTPLPFRSTRGGFADLFRTHFFLNAGNLCNLNYGQFVRVAWISEDLQYTKRFMFIHQICAWSCIHIAHNYCCLSFILDFIWAYNISTLTQNMCMHMCVLIRLKGSN